jgi:glycosyltransferase involved in cell wall biosynthesis
MELRKMEKISIIVPCYNEEENITAFYNRINEISDKLKKVNCEYIFIDDGSKDKTLTLIKELYKKDKRVKYVSFSRNFGKEAGMYAGLQKATGDYAVIIDADLQHDPELIIEMYNTISTTDYDSVATYRNNPSIASRAFYKLFKKISDIEVVDGEMDYRMMSKKMYKAVLSMSECNRFSKGMFSWVGFKTKWLLQKNLERHAGKSKWSFKKLFIYFIDGIIGFSTVPLIIPLFTGMILMAITFVIILINLIMGLPITSPSYLVSLILFISSINFFFLGIGFQYIAKIYTETKKRPIYIEKESSED